MWVTLPAKWKLQDVQAALNVIIAFLCAASVFVLVRHFWVVAARKVTKKRDVPAYALLSLNTIGESIDLIWLLRHEILTARYRSLLVQCVFVVVLTAATLASGFLARFSTRSVITLEVRPVIASLASRYETALLYDILDVSTVFHGLQAAKFPQDKLAEFWPDPNSNWTYNEAQWNSSWTMECTYVNSTAIQNPEIVTNNCTGGTWQQFLPINDAWKDWPKVKNNKWVSWTDDWISYQGDDEKVKDVYLFAHGIEILEYHEMGIAPDNYTISTAVNMQTVAFHLSGVPPNTNEKSSCDWAQGSIDAAEYSSATCNLRRNLGNKTAEELNYWGTLPDYYDTTRQVSIFPQFYSGRLRRESYANVPITKIPGTELVTLYQAYQITKDTSGSVNWDISEARKPKVKRELDVQVRAAQVSLTCLIVCAVMATVALIGIANYWWFLLRNLKRLDLTPQSKLDWMLHTLKTESSAIGKGSGYSQGHIHAPSLEQGDINVKIRHKLRNSMLVGSQIDLTSDAVPLTKMVTKDDDGELSGMKSKTTSIMSTRSTDYFSHDSPAITGSDYVISPPSAGMGAWVSHSPYQQVNVQTPQYHDYSHGSSPGLGIMGQTFSNQGRYQRVGSMTSPVESYGYMDRMDTAYDPARR